jgi:hypothetical protein
MPEMTISIDSETYKRLLKHLPADIKSRIERQVTRLFGELATSIDCDGNDEDKIIAIARQHIPDKAWEIEREVRIARAERQGTTK